MNLANVRIGVRLTAGYGLIVLLLVILVAVCLNRLTDIGTINDQIIQQEWAKADAAQRINARTQANAHATMQLFITNEPSGITTIDQEIGDNKAVIDRALATLDKLVERADGRDLLAKIRESRTAYVGSFTCVAQLLAQGSRDQATALTNTEIVPTLERL